MQNLCLLSLTYKILSLQLRSATATQTGCGYITCTCDTNLLQVQKATKQIKEVGMVWAKSTQTGKVGIITDQMHLYILFSSKYNEKCVGMNSVSYPYYSCLYLRLLSISALLWCGY